MVDNKGVKIANDFEFRADDKKYTRYGAVFSTYEKHNYNNYKINIENDDIGMAAEQEIALYPDLNYMFIDSMNSTQESKGLGTCMHLLNIIEMFENQINNIDLLSASSAIPFHTRLGFYPCDKWENGLSENIERIVKNNIKGLETYTKSADRLLKSKLSNEEKTVFGNKLLFDYTKAAINKLSKSELEYLFLNETHMRLGKEYILNNKNFYNDLLGKYYIDYEI